MTIARKKASADFIVGDLGNNDPRVPLPASTDTKSIISNLGVGCASLPRGPASSMIVSTTGAISGVKARSLEEAIRIACNPSRRLDAVPQSFRFIVLRRRSAISSAVLFRSFSPGAPWTWTQSTLADLDFAERRFGQSNVCPQHGNSPNKTAWAF